MYILYILVSAALLGVVVFLIIQVKKLKRELIQQQVSFDKQKSKISADAKKRSGSVQWGLTIENFVPFIDVFPIPPENTHHLGKPIDFLGFTDLDKPETTTVHLIEVKSGTAFLNGHQKNIKKAVEDGRVKWHEVRVKANTVK